MASAALAEELSDADNYKRVRVMECANSPAVQLLLYRCGQSLAEIGSVPPAWQTLPAETVDDHEKLRDVMTTGVYDIIITSDEGYAKELLSRGLVRKAVPIFRERVVLAGLARDLSGLGVAEIMKSIFDEKLLFFSRLSDKAIIDAENELWRLAGIDRPGESRGYVETGRDEAGALFQADEEGGFILAGEASFALYLGSTSSHVLSSLSDTGYFRTTYACLTENFGFRKIRTEDAEKYMEWFAGEDGKNVVSTFSIGELNPFLPGE
jgi:ABC-type tungstate transport system permease subunit